MYSVPHWQLSLHFSLPTFGLLFYIFIQFICHSFLSFKMRFSMAGRKTHVKNTKERKWKLIHIFLLQPHALPCGTSIRQNRVEVNGIQWKHSVSFPISLYPSPFDPLHLSVAWKCHLRIGCTFVSSWVPATDYFVDTQLRLLRTKGWPREISSKEIVSIEWALIDSRIFLLSLQRRYIELRGNICIYRLK